MFLVITGGVLAGMGSLSLLFGETVKYQAEDQIKATLNNKVSSIEDVIEQAETLAYGLNISVKTLHVRRAETPETYQELVRQLFQGRPNFVTGLGFGQAEYGILPSQQWLFPYYYAASAENPALEAAEQPTELPSEFLYIDQAAPENFYPETEQYRNYFLPQETIWTTPYASDRGLLLTYYSPILDPQGQWLGTAVIDLDGTYLSQVLNEPILRGGGELMLLSATGNVIANPANPGDLGTQTYEDIPGLRAIWDQVGSDASGFIEGETGYWAYTQMPEKGWVLLAHVPYITVFREVMLITLGATTVVGLLLAGMLLLVLRYLNRRVHPVLAECHRLSEGDGVIMEHLQDKDEIDQLSTAFFYLLDKHTQQSSKLDLVTQQRQMLERAMMADDEQMMSQMQQWADTTDRLSSTLTTQAAAVESAGNASRETLAVSQEKMAAAIAKVEELHQSTAPLLEHMQTLVSATDRSAQMTEKHERIVNVAKAVLSDSLPLLTRTVPSPDPNEMDNKTNRLQRFANRLQELTDEFKQASSEQRSHHQQVDTVQAHLNDCMRIFDRYVQELASQLEASHHALDHNQVTIHQLTHTGEQVTHSTQQLEALSQTMQRTIQEGAIAETTQASS
ncbi:MAG: hypothetical protein AAFY20_18415 [Cyanobacteria bacterium J06639_14]